VSYPFPSSLSIPTLPPAFKAQFEDPRLRTQFNLIVIDMRGYGTTKGMIDQEIYTPADAADDVYWFIVSIFDASWVSSPQFSIDST